MGSLERSSDATIPVIDLSSQNPIAPSELLDALTKYGFVFIENNKAGVPPSLVSEMFELSKQFFASPTEIKEIVSISSNEAGKNHGWLSRGVEKLDPATQKRPDVKEAFNLGELENGEPRQPLPELFESHLEILKDFQYACHKFCQKIFENLAEALKIDRDWITSRHDRSKGPIGSVMRMLYYPQVENIEDDVDIRAGAHSDYGSVTLLFQLPGQPGLEIRTPSGEWAQVPVNPDACNALKDQTESLPILVNIGDLLEDWTGGLLKSTVHRVVFPKGTSPLEDRYSLAYFCHPLDDAELEPVPSELVQARIAEAGTQRVTTNNGKPITAKDHLMERLAATYTIK